MYVLILLRHELCVSPDVSKNTFQEPVTIPKTVKKYSGILYFPRFETSKNTPQGPKIILETLSNILKYSIQPQKIFAFSEKVLLQTRNYSRNYSRNIPRNNRNIPGTVRRNSFYVPGNNWEYCSQEQNRNSSQEYSGIFLGIFRNCSQELFQPGIVPRNIPIVPGYNCSRQTW